MKLKEATMVGPIHTVKSGHIKKELSLQDSPTHKAMKNIVLNGNFVELTVKTSNELILVPFTNFSHMVPDAN
jgi:hypothetical protein